MKYQKCKKENLSRWTQRKRISLTGSRTPVSRALSVDKRKSWPLDHQRLVIVEEDMVIKHNKSWGFGAGIRWMCGFSWKKILQWGEPLRNVEGRKKSGSNKGIFIHKQETGSVCMKSCWVGLQGFMLIHCVVHPTISSSDSCRHLWQKIIDFFLFSCSFSSQQCVLQLIHQNLVRTVMISQ